MKRALVSITVVVSLFSFSAQTNASGFLEIWMASPEFTLVVDGGYGLVLDKREEWVISAFFLITSKWAQVYVGPTYTPWPWITLGLSLGIAQGKDLKGRGAILLALKHRWIEFMGVLEMDHDAILDPSSIWYDLELTTRPLKWLVVGLKGRRFVGAGIVVKATVWRFTLWLTWAPLDFERPVLDPGQGEVFDPFVFLGGLIFRM